MLKDELQRARHSERLAKEKLVQLMATPNFVTICLFLFFFLSFFLSFFLVLLYAILYAKVDNLNLMCQIIRC